MTFIFIFNITIYKTIESQEIKDEIYYNKEVINLYKEGFYEFMPKGYKEEAFEKYEKAVEQFKKSIAINENYVEAHLNLARVYYVQKKFPEAAEEYKIVTELTPYDLDAYVKLASAYAKMARYDDAIEQLEKAKNLTDQEIVVEKLNALIDKLEQAK